MVGINDDGRWLCVEEAAVDAQLRQSKMKTQVLERVSSVGEAKAALDALMPSQSETWVLRASDGDAIAYFNVVASDVDVVGPANTADISGRHCDEDQRVIDILVMLQLKVGGIVKRDA